MPLVSRRIGVRRPMLTGLLLLGVLMLAVGWSEPSASAQIPGQLRVSAGGPYVGTVGQPVTFVAQINTGGLPPNSPIQVQWSFGDGRTGFGQTATHVYTTAGTFSVTVIATAGAGQTASSSTTAQIHPGITPGQLTVNAGGPYSGPAGVPITFNAIVGLGGRPPGTAVQVVWNFGDGSSSVGVSTTHTYAAAGVYTVTVIASIGPTQTATNSTTARITAPVTPLVVNPGGPYSGRVGQPITFSGSATGALLGATVGYSWSFGDGSVGSGQTVTHTYSAPGTYTATLTVSTSSGQQASASTTVTVTAGTDAISLTTGCTNLTLTWPNGTSISVVAGAISPTSALSSIWRYDAAQGRFLGYTPTAPSFANDLLTVNRLDAVFVCVSSPATLNRPAL
ncbi:MAG: PKD domain-containing protein [Dehalococcoidia bacterium]